MNDFSREQQIPPAEIAKAEAMLTPEQRVMSRVRANILTPLDYMELPEDQAKTIRDYSDKASKVVRSEFERLQKESPANMILRVLEQNLETITDQRNRSRALANINRLNSSLKEWQNSIAVQEGLNLSLKRSKTKTEIIEQLEQELMVDTSQSVLDTEFFSFSSNEIGGHDRRDTILRQLGYFPKGVNFMSFFTLPLQADQTDIKKLMWGGTPVQITRLHNPNVRIITGLTSDKLPGVIVNLEQHPKDNLVCFYFNTDAIARSTSTIPAVIA